MFDRDFGVATWRRSSCRITRLHSDSRAAGFARNPRFVAADTWRIARLHSGYRAASFATNPRFVAVADTCRGSYPNSHTDQAHADQRTGKPNAQHERQFLARQLPFERPAPIPGTSGEFPIFPKSVSQSDQSDRRTFQRTKPTG